MTDNDPSSVTKHLRSKAMPLVDERWAPSSQRSRGSAWLLPLVSGTAALVALGALVSACGADNKTTSTAPISTATANPQFGETLSQLYGKPSPGPMTKYAAKMKRLGWRKYTDALWIKPDGVAVSDSFSVTWRIRVVSPAGCSGGVYLEANILDASNSVVDYANDFLPTLRANQQAILTISSTARGTIHPDFTKLECH